MRNRRRRKKGGITLSGGEVAVERATKVGRPPQEDAKATVIAARLRRMPQECHPEATSPLAGCAAGRAILGFVAGADDRAVLWGAVCHIRRTYAAYDRALGGPPRYAKCQRILLPVDAMETSAEAPALDTRTEEERQRHAVSAFMQVETWLGYTTKAARSACLRAVIDEPEGPVKLWPNVRAALLCVADGLAGRKVVYRGGYHR